MSVDPKSGQAGGTVKITDTSFETDVMKSTKPVLVDFWASWCGPCLAIAPSLEEIAKDLSGKVTIAKLNIEENPATPDKYRVRAVPALMVFKDGQVAGTKVGGMPKHKLKEWVRSFA
jgi:thioredoxin 1